MEKRPILSPTLGILIIVIFIAWEMRQPITFEKNKVASTGVQEHNPALDDPNIALIEYVQPRLVPAVKLFNQGNYRGAMLVAEKISARGTMMVQAQAAYLRGLCLQELGNFEEGNAEYAKVLLLTDKKELLSKAYRGKESCAAHNQTIEATQLQFPMSSLGLPRGQTNIKFK